MGLPHSQWRPSAEGEGGVYHREVDCGGVEPGGRVRCEGWVELCFPHSWYFVGGDGRSSCSYSRLEE